MKSEKQPLCNKYTPIPRPGGPPFHDDDDDNLDDDDDDDDDVGDADYYVRCHIHNYPI